MMTFHPKAVFWIYLQKRIYQRSQIWIRNLIWENKITRQYLVEHCLVTFSLERSNPAGHLVKNNAQSPQICESPRSSLFQHFWWDIKRRSDKSVFSFWFLSLCSANSFGKKRSPKILTIVECFGVSKIDLVKNYSKSGRYLQSLNTNCHLT